MSQRWWETRTAAGDEVIDFVTVEGWVSAYPEEWVRFYLRQPPRRYSYLKQFKIDAKSRRPWILWALACGLIALGLTVTHWAVALVGLLFLYVYYFSLRHTVNENRTAVLGTGIVKLLKPHPSIPDHSLSGALQPDGTVIQVMVPTVMAEPLIEKHGRCEVLFFRKLPFGKTQPPFGVSIGVRQFQEGPGLDMLAEGPNPPDPASER